MKKNFKYAILSAIALVGAVSLTSCSSSDDVDVNPTFDGESVKTQFTISLPNNVVSSTRQSAATVQAAQTVASFRGFDNMVLIPYGAVSSSDVSGNRLIASSIVLKPETGDNNTMPAASLAIDGDNSKYPNSYVYSDVKIPLGTSGFLFYGKAPDSGTDNFVNGALTAAPTGLTGEKSGFSFSLVPTQSGDDVSTTLLAYINAVAAATGWASSTNEGLKGLYNNFITLKAGSSRSVCAALEDLYESLMDNTDDVSTAICTAILTQATYSSNKLTLKDAVAGYPEDNNLPDGAVGLKWTKTSSPAVARWAEAGDAPDDLDPDADPGVEESWNTGTNTLTALDHYVYPASLYYRADSPVSVSDEKESDNYLDYADWATVVSSLYTSSAVTNTTQSVALNEQIQYAVGLLESTIGIGANTLYDRNGEAINIGTGEGKDGTLSVTGILIGNQRNVDWQFLPMSTSGVYTIYDKMIPSSNVLSDASTSVKDYTLTLETPSETATSEVFVAVEFENKAKDFIGKEGLVPKGTRFYLIAKLKPSEGDGYDASTLNKVFIQDYKTTATFTVTPGLSKDDGQWGGSNDTGLGAAYNVIPDLRTPKMELGLSVNLTWQTGLDFDVDL